MIEELSEYLVRHCCWEQDIADDVHAAYVAGNTNEEERRLVIEVAGNMDDAEHLYAREVIFRVRCWQRDVGEEVWPYQDGDIMIQGLDDIDPVSGWTHAEKRCHDALMLAYKEFIDLPRQHPDEMRDFVDPLHRLQDLLAVRIVRRVFPAGWPTHESGRMAETVDAR